MPVQVEVMPTRVFRHSFKLPLTILGVGAGMVAIAGVVSGFSPVGAAVVLGICLPPAGYFAYLALQTRLVVDAEGVRFVAPGEKAEVKWMDIEGTSSGAQEGVPKAKRYSLYSNGAAVLTFTSDLGDAERAFRTVERRIHSDLYPRLRDALARNETVRFGTVALSSAQVEVGRVRMPLNTARFVREAGGLSLVNRLTSEVTITVPEGDVQNIGILVRCAGEIDPALVGSTRPRVGSVPS